jgi:hypothetical protein
LFDNEIEAARIRRIKLIRKVMLFALFFLLLLGLVWSVSLLLERNNKSVSSPKKNVPNIIGTKAISPNTLNAETARQVFQQRLVAFEEARAPLLADEDFIRWNPAAAATISNTKAQALALFAQGQYSEAINTLEQADNAVLQVDKKWQQAYENAIEKALSAYTQAAADNSHISDAQLLLNQALNIKPKDPRGLLLLQQLASYPRIAQLLQDLTVAKIENNLPKQAAILKKILAEDPTQEALLKELNAVQQSINESEFTQHIARGFAAIDNDKINAATVAYQQAKAIYPKRTEVNTLQQKIAQKSHRDGLDKIIAQVVLDKKNDNWAGIVATRQSPYAADPALQGYQQEAQKILALQQQADRYLDRPERLQDEGIRQQALEFVRKNFTLTTVSPYFAEQIQRLSALATKAQRKQTLRIQSNGKTDIWVLGVGHVGEVTDKEVALLPGRYTLEGRCEGYRHKQITVELAETNAAENTSAALQNITLVCDEPIR